MGMINFCKNFDESRDISVGAIGAIGTMGTIGTMETMEETFIITLMKVE